MRVVTFVLTLVSLAGCASASRENDLRRMQLKVPGLPDNLWEGYAPGSWVRVGWVGQWGKGVSKIKVASDGRVLEEESNPRSTVPHNISDLQHSILRGDPREWVDEAKAEEIEVGGKRFLCQIRRGETFLIQVGGESNDGIPIPKRVYRVWSSSEAPTPDGVLQWTVEVEGKLNARFRYTSIADPLVAEVERFKGGERKLRGVLVLDEQVPGWIVEKRTYRQPNDRLSRNTVLKVLDYHVAVPGEESNKP